MKLTISTPFSYKTFSVAWLEINAPTGNYVIQRGHAPMIITLSENQPLIYRLKSGREESVIVRQGIVTIERESASVIMTQLDTA